MIFKLSIRAKLLGSFSIIIALFLVTGYLSINKMNDMGKSAKGIQENWMPSVYSLGQLYGDVIDTQRILLRLVVETDEKELERLTKRINEVLEVNQKSRQNYLAIPHTEEESKLFAEFGKHYDAYVANFPQLIKLGRENRYDEFNAIHTVAHEDYKKANAIIKELISANKANSDVETALVVEANQSSKSLTIIMMSAAVLVALVLALMMSLYISRRIDELKRLFSAAASGDLSQSIEVRNQDELGVMANSVNEMMAKLRYVLEQASTSSQSVAAASEEISASTQEVSSGTMDQSRSAQVISELLNELTKATESVAKNAEASSEISNATLMEARKGGSVLMASVQGMKRLNDQMGRLQDDSTKIGEIIEVINDIADQTNLLALNAAIEAARAGEQGRGFAVVADEVRKLAERSGEATKQIATIIKAMQNNTEQSVVAVQEAVAMSSETGEAFEQIIERVSSTAMQASEIAAACEEQSAQGKEVLHTVETIVAASQQVAAATEETASASQSMASLAQDLSASLAFFKVR